MDGSEAALGLARVVAAAAEGATRKDHVRLITCSQHSLPREEVMSDYRVGDLRMSASK
jgi:hypothetical protein